MIVTKLIRVILPIVSLQVLSEASTYDEAVTVLGKEELVAPAYFIAAGSKAEQGVVITRDRSAVDLWQLQPSAVPSSWYLLETNYVSSSLVSCYVKFYYGAFSMIIIIILPSNIRITAIIIQSLTSIHNASLTSIHEGLYYASIMIMLFTLAVYNFLLLVDSLTTLFYSALQDHWKPVYPYDDRRTYGNKYMQALGRAAAASFPGLLEVLTRWPVQNDLTTHTALMCPRNSSMTAYIVLT